MSEQHPEYEDEEDQEDGDNSGDNGDNPEEDDDALTQHLVLSENPLIDDHLIKRLVYDLATGIHGSKDIAQRYSFTGPDRLKDYLFEHPTIVSQAQQLRSMFQSGASAEDRVRLKSLYAVEDLIIPMAGICSDPKMPLAARVDSFKSLQRSAGVDGIGAAAKNQQAIAGQPFQLSIIFQGQPPVNITATDLHNVAELPVALPTTIAEDPDDIGDDV